MVIRWNRFNIYFLAGLLSLAVSGCKTEQGKLDKEHASFRVHQQMNPDPMGRTEQVAVYREHPVNFTIDKNPVVTEGNIKEAKVVDVVGGFALRIQLDRQGSWLLEQATAGLRGRHIVIFSQWVDPPDEKINQGRWLAAPRVQNHISDGVLVFTPDASRYEAEQIARGLNNVAKKLQSQE